MDEQTTNHSALAQNRISHQVQVQSRQLERLLDEHTAASEIERVDANEQETRFVLDLPFKKGLELLKDVKQELMAALGVGDVRLTRENGKLQVLVTHLDAPPVSFLDLLPMVPKDLPPSTAVLGIDGDQTPILLSFKSEQLAHLLVGGGTQAGKTALLRTIAISLAMLNRQSQLQLAILSPNNQQTPTDLSLLNYLPHMLEPVATSVEASLETLAFLSEEVAYRQTQQLEIPLIAVLIDDVDFLLGEETAVEQLVFLLQNGPAQGIHLCLTANEEKFQQIPHMVKANIPLRLVGQASSIEYAKQMSGFVDSDADLLYGKGHFLSIVGEEMGEFQVAFVNDYDLHLCIETLYSQRPRPILAKQIKPKPVITLPIENPPSTEKVSIISSSSVPKPQVDRIINERSAEPYLPHKPDKRWSAEDKKASDVTASFSADDPEEIIPFDLGSPPDTNKE